MATVSASRCRCAAHGRAAAARRRRRRWATSTRSATRAARRASCSTRQRFDLIFVHCSSVAQYVEHVRGVPKILDFGDMDSQKWLEYANYKPFPLVGWAIGSRASKLRARGAPLGARSSTCARRRPAPNGRRSTATPPGRRPTGSRTASTASYFQPDRRAVRARHASASSAAWTTTRTRSAWRGSAARCWPVLRARATPAEAADRRRRSDARDARRSADLPASRSPVRCPTCGRTSCARR